MATRQSALNSDRTASIKLSRLRPGRHRLRFQEAEVEALKESISKHGLLHPIVARRTENDSELEVISGHRRLEALRRIGAEDVSCKIVEATDREAFEISLVENLQRESIDPIEEAMAFHQYIDVCRWGTRRTLADRIGRSPEYISHRLQLLQLPQDVLSKVGTQLSPSHGEELAWLDDEKATRRLAALTAEKKLSVHDLHELIKLEKKRCNVKPARTAFLREADFDKRGQSRAERAGHQIEEILKTNVVALRYLMYYLDNCVNSLNGEKENFEFAKFLRSERYKVHQILDDFISAEVRARRALNRRDVLGLS